MNTTLEVLDVVLVVIVASIVVARVVNALLRRHRHAWGPYEEPVSRSVQRAPDDYDGTDSPPFTITEQRQRCTTCGLVRWKRID